MKRWIRVIAFLMAFVAVYIVVDDILGTKADDAIEPMDKLYLLPEDTADVMFIGASHIGMNVDNKMLWDQHGIASYSLWGGMQPVWNSYYFLKEGLKEQTPKVVMVEVFLAGTTVDYSTEAVAMKNIHGMKFSVDKVKAALASFPTWQKAASAIWGMPYYHTRYGEITAQDLQLFGNRYDLDINEIVLPSDKITRVNMLDYKSITGTEKLTEKNEKYLRMMIDLCKAKGTELVFVIAPYEATEQECRRLNSLEQIAREEGVRMVNYLKIYQEAGIDPETDFYDIGHLSYSGIQKFSRHIGDYLHSNFDLPDRRLDENHIWNRAREVDATTRVYAMEEAFVGDGAGRFVDTGVKLYGNRYDSWTLLTRLDMRIMESDMVYLSCFSEEADKGYYGLLIRKSRENQLAVILGGNIDVIVPETDKDIVDLAIVKESEKYTVYLNGEKVSDKVELPCEAYDGTLLVGCQELSAGGDKFRFSRTQVKNLEVYSEVLDERTIKTWNPEPLPEPEMPLGMLTETPETVYTLPEKFNGAAAPGTYVDTGVRLLESAGTRFTLLASLMPEDTPGDNVFFSCFSEVPGEYRGLLVRQLTEQRLDIIVGNNHGFILPITLGEPINLAIVKDGSVYTAYVNGEKVIDREESRCAAFDGTLLLGAQTDAQGNIFRQSQTRVNSLTVMAGVMSEADILAWPYTEAPDQAPPKPVTSIYTLPHAFAGDGSDNYEDTGVQLFKNPQMNWTLQATVRPRNGGNDGVFFSAFSEDPSAYRGLMLRQDSTDSVTLYMGQLQTCPIAIPEGSDRMSLVVVKQGSHYSVYVNGEKIRELDSPCAAYAGTLLVGCQESVTGEPFRFSTAKVDVLEIWDGALPEEEALRLSKPVITHNRFN